MATCKQCGVTDDEAFYASVHKKGNPRGVWCKVCQRAYYRKRVADDKEYFLRYQRERVRATAEQLAEIRAVGGCMKCGENHPAVLDFHHRDDSKKLFNISLAGSRGKKTLQQMQEEIDKCDILCSNCHRKLHYEERAAGKISPRRTSNNGWDGF